MVVMTEYAARSSDLESLIRSLYDATNANGRVILTCRDGQGSLAGLFSHLESNLAAQGCSDQLKYQFNHVLEHHQWLESSALAGTHLSYDALLRILRGGGFTRIEELGGFEDGHTTVVVASK